MAGVRNDLCLGNYFALQANQATREMISQDKVLEKKIHFQPLVRKNGLHPPEKMIDNYQN